MGFGAQGIGMGNAITAVNFNEIISYYNPASTFTSQRSISVSFGLLSLDRSLNFLYYTQAIPPRGGISAGVLNASVRKIDGRDNDGNHTKNYSTFENQFFLSFSNQLRDDFSIGVAIKLYYAKLFEEVTSTTVGFDLGINFMITPELSLGIMAADLGSKYKWDTSPIYGRDGKSSLDKFPVIKRIGITYKPSYLSGLVGATYEHISSELIFFKVGAEYNIIEEFSVRGGVDRIDISRKTDGIKPAFGFTIKNSFNNLKPSISYAFMIEPFAPSDIHIVTLSVKF